MQETPFSSQKIMTCATLATIFAFFWFTIIPLFLSIGLLVCLYFMLRKNHNALQTKITELQETNHLTENPLWETTEPGGLPSVYSEGKPSRPKKKGGLPMVTYSDLIQFCIFIVALVGLCYSIFQGKK